MVFKVLLGIPQIIPLIFGKDFQITNFVPHFWLSFVHVAIWCNRGFVNIIHCVFFGIVILSCFKVKF